MAKLSSSLTPHEIQTLQLLANGYNTKGIANSLHVSHHTIETCRKAILKKMNADNSTQAVVVAFRKRLSV